MVKLLSLNNILIFIFIIIIITFIYLYFINNKHNDTFILNSNIILNINENNKNTYLKPNRDLSGTIINLVNYYNITSFYITTYDNETLEMNIKIDNELLTYNNSSVLESNVHYDISNKNYNINKFELLLIDSDYNEIISRIKNIQIYGYINEYDTIKINYIDNDNKDNGSYIDYKNNKLILNFNKLNNKNIIEYIVIVVKYNNKRELINKYLINLNSLNYDFYLELEKKIPKHLINFNNINSNITNNQISEHTPFISVKEILKQNGYYNYNEIFNIFIKYYYYKYINEPEPNNFKIILDFINNYSNKKIQTNITKNTFLVNYESNLYYTLDEDIRKLIDFLYNLIKDEEHINKCNNLTCNAVVLDLDIVDEFNEPFYYKIGITYTYSSSTGREILYDKITTFIPKYKDDIFNMLDVDDNNKSKNTNSTLLDMSLFDKLNVLNTTNINKLKSIVGVQYPNTFNITTENIKKFIDIKDHKDIIASPILIEYT